MDHQLRRQQHRLQRLQSDQTRRASQGWLAAQVPSQAPLQGAAQGSRPALHLVQPVGAAQGL